MSSVKYNRRIKIKSRVRKKISGLSEVPRISVFKSNKEIYVQVIDDSKKRTLFSVSSRDKDIFIDKGTKTAVAVQVGKRLAEKAKKVGIERFVFDRNGYLYHGRIKSLAEAAKEMGLKF
ncbi:MAG: 50S ribosomal protein L18 [Flavobacteriales bacterium Tduv]